MKLSYFLAYFILLFTEFSFAMNDEQILFPPNLTAKILDSKSINKSTLFSFIVNGKIASLFSEEVITARIRCMMNVYLTASDASPNLKDNEVFQLVFSEKSVESSYSSFSFKFVNEKDNHELILSCHSLRNGEFNLDTLSHTVSNLIELY